MWKIALYGTNSLVKSDSNSLVDLSALGSVDPMTEDSWVKIDILGLNPHWEMLQDSDEGNSGIGIHNPAQKRTFEITTESFVFPDDMHKIEAIARVLAHRRVFLFKGEYPETTEWAIHPDGKAVQVVMTTETEDEWDDGTKALTLAGRFQKPRRNLA